jgi:hypothetical protein
MRLIVEDLCHIDVNHLARTFSTDHGNSPTRWLSCLAMLERSADAIARRNTPRATALFGKVP